MAYPGKPSNTGHRGWKVNGRYDYKITQENNLENEYILWGMWKLHSGESGRATDELHF